jgi:hypothetical protein
MFKYLKYENQDSHFENKFINKFIDLIKLYFATFIFTILSILLIIIIDNIIVNILNQKSIYNEIRNSNVQIKNMFGGYSPIFVIILIPFIEELIFRLPLNLKKSSIAISITFLYLRFSGGFFTHLFNYKNFEDIIKIVIALLIFIFSMNIMNQKKLDFIKLIYYKQYFYFIAVAFGLIHIINFHQINFYLFFLYPIYVLPQFFMGLSIGKIRVKYGFFWGWALHAMINSTSFLLP